MKRVLPFVLLLVLSSFPLIAHGGNDHVRGTVTEITPTSVTVQIADKSTKTLTITAKTKFAKSGQPAAAGELRVGDRVIVDVPTGKTEAVVISFGPPKKAPAKK